METLTPSNRLDPAERPLRPTEAGRALVPQRLDLTPAAVLAAEARLLELEQVACPLRHYFAPGVCVREVRMPAGSLIIGHAHRFADLNIMLTGRLTLLNEDGSTTERQAPLTFLGQPGRKIALIHEDVVWQNVWATQVGRAALPRGQAEQQLRPTEMVDLGTDIEAIEAYYLDKSPGWQADQAQRLAIARLTRLPDRESFAEFLAAHELPADDVRRISENPADQVPLPAGDWKFQIGESAIEGKGVLATADIAEDEVIGPARLSGQRTPLGRFTNHAAQPNTRMIVQDGDIYVKAIWPIAGCRGGQPGEEITVNYEQALQANAESVVENAKTKGLELCQP